MLKSLIFGFILGMTFSAYARDSQFETCVTIMKSEFLASTAEAVTVCQQNSSREFVDCMVRKARNSNIHILDAAPICSKPRIRIPIESNDPTYAHFNSCPNKLVAEAQMKQNRARQICDWDNSPVMLNCIVNLVQGANFHSEHAIQYCGFANTEYRKKIPQFVSCVIDNSKYEFRVRPGASFIQYQQTIHENVMNCDARLTGYYNPKPKPKPRPEPRDERLPEPQYDPGYPYPRYPEKRPETQPETQPEQQQPQQPEVKAPETQPGATPEAEEPVQKSPNRKVPVPVEIKIEGTKEPEVKDQPIETGSTSNSEALPL